MAALTPAQIANLTPAQIPNLTPAQIANLTPTLIRALTPAQIAALTPALIAALTSALIAALTPAQIAALTPAQIADLTSLDIGDLPKESLLAFTPAQKQAFTDSQKADFQARVDAEFNDIHTRLNDFLENPVTGAITNNDLSDYLNIVYLRGGLQTTLNIDKFMASFEPGAVTSGDTSAFCANLFGFRSQLYRKLLTRTEDNPRQCKAAGYGKSVGVKCIWCGEWILDFPECEHALPILMAASLLGFSTANANEIEKILEYGSSHRLCNQVKNAIALLKWDSATNRWEIDWRNVHQMYDDIATNGGFANNRMRYQLLNNGTANLLSDNIQNATHPGYLSWSMPQLVDGRDYDTRNRNQNILGACNGLSNRGLHRNRNHIQRACRTIAGRITVTPAVSQYNHNHGGNLVQVAGSRKKKSKKKKQKGGFFDPTQIQNLPLQNQLLQNPANLRTYLSQGPDTTNAWGVNSVANNNPDLYFLARLVAIRERLNSVNTAMNGDMDKIRMYMICKIILGPDVDMLIKDLGGASPPDPEHDYNMLMKERELLMKKIKRAIKDYKKLGPESLLGLGVRITTRRQNHIMRTNTNYEELKQMIETEVDDHNTRVDTFGAPPSPKSLDNCKIDIDHETRVTKKLPKFIDWDNVKDQYRTLITGNIPGWLDNRIQDGGVRGKRGREGDGGDVVEAKRERVQRGAEHEEFAFNVLEPLIRKYALEEYKTYERVAARKANKCPAYLLFNYLSYPSNENAVFTDLGQIIDDLATELSIGEETQEQIDIAHELALQVEQREENAEHLKLAMALAANDDTETLGILGIVRDTTGGERPRLLKFPTIHVKPGLPFSTNHSKSSMVGDGGGGGEVTSLPTKHLHLRATPTWAEGQPFSAAKPWAVVPLVPTGGMGGSRKKTSKKAKKKENKKTKKLNKRKN